MFRNQRIMSSHLREMNQNAQYIYANTVNGGQGAAWPVDSYFARHSTTYSQDPDFFAPTKKGLWAFSGLIVPTRRTNTDATTFTFAAHGANMLVRIRLYIGTALYSGGTITLNTAGWYTVGLSASAALLPPGTPIACFFDAAALNSTVAADKTDRLWAVHWGERLMESDIMA